MVSLTFASVVIALNWGGFICGVTNGHVIETSAWATSSTRSMTVLLGVFVLGETPAAGCSGWPSRSARSPSSC